MSMSIKPAIVIVVLVIIVGVWLGGKPLTQPSNDPTTTATPTLTQPTDHGPEEGAHGEDPTPATPNIDGGEDTNWEHDLDTQKAALTTTSAFVDGWLNPDPDQRRAQLASVTAEELVDQLTLTGLRTWNTEAAGEPELVHLAGTAAMTRQHFVDGRAIDVLLLLGPSAPAVWTVTDVQPAGQ